ncbi:MAG: hypothetical protein ACH349_07795, partial [Candidatus Rhabdochlamydia sp.]
YLREVTIPSLRCHPGTVALIEKIKAEAFNNSQHILCLIKDFKVRVIDSKLFQKELAIEKNNLAFSVQDNFFLPLSKHTYNAFFFFVRASCTYTQPH